MSCNLEQFQEYLISGAQLSVELGSHNQSSFDEAWAIQKKFNDLEFVQSLIAIDKLVGYNFYQPIVQALGLSETEEKKALVLAESLYKFVEHDEDKFTAAWDHALYFASVPTMAIIEQTLPGILTTASHVTTQAIEHDDTLSVPMRAFSGMVMARLLLELGTTPDGLGVVSDEALEPYLSVWNDYVNKASVYNHYVTAISDTAPVLLEIDFGEARLTSEGVSLQTESSQLKSAIKTIQSFIESNESFAKAMELMDTKGVTVATINSLIDIDKLASLVSVSGYADTLCEPAE